MQDILHIHFNKLKIKFTICFIELFLFTVLTGQQTPSKPYSNPIFSPIVINPAIIGSKDYTNINLISRLSGKPTAQSLSIHTRLAKQDGFTNFGIGGFIFHDRLVNSSNIGLNVGGAYHIPIGKNSLSNISIGLAIKGIYNFPIENAEAITIDSTDGILTPNFDFGVYYYGPTAFIGLSVINGLENIFDNDIIEQDECYTPREYNLYGGYKFLLSRKFSIVLEPSVLLNVQDETLSKFYEHITPYLKLYIQNGYIGTYYKDIDHLAVFFQYEFPRIIAGMFFEAPRKEFLSSQNIIIEGSLGINLSKEKTMFPRYRHW